MEINREITPKEARTLYKESKGKISESVGSFVTLKHVNKIYDSGNQAVTDFNLEIGKGEFVALVGPSGCGKSTTLRMIAGLEEITSGELYIDGVLSNYLPSKERDIAMVFQSYALYPQLNVYDNIAFGLKLRKVDKAIIKEKVFEAAKILDLGPYLDRKPKELSGGQRQRVALARAVVREAKAYLLDEPLSNLDAKLRTQMRVEITKLYEKLKATFIYVTHDQTEAMTMGTRIVVMKDGWIQQIDTPVHLYDHPKNLFVATFIGTPQMNIFPGTLECKKRDAIITLSGDRKIRIRAARVAKPEAKEVYLGIRSEDVYIDENGLPAKVRMIETLGSETLIYLDFGGGETIVDSDNFIVKIQGRVPYAVGDTVRISFNTDKIHLFERETEESILHIQ